MAGSVQDKPSPLAQLLESQVGLAARQIPHFLMMSLKDDRLMPGKMVAWADLSGSPTLLQETMPSETP